MEKNRPDTYFENTSDRWLTTTGLEKAQRARGTIILQPENRTSTTREYYGGGGGENNTMYQTENYKESKRNVLDPYSKYLGGATKANAWENTDAGNYGREGFVALPNSRTLNRKETNMGPVQSVVSALTAPIMDMLRPSRKENVIGNRPAVMPKDLKLNLYLILPTQPKLPLRNKQHTNISFGGQSWWRIFHSSISTC